MEQFNDSDPIHIKTIKSQQYKNHDSIIPIEKYLWRLSLIPPVIYLLDSTRDKRFHVDIIIIILEFFVFSSKVPLERSFFKLYCT